MVTGDIFQLRLLHRLKDETHEVYHVASDFAKFPQLNEIDENNPERSVDDLLKKASKNYMWSVVFEFDRNGDFGNAMWKDHIGNVP